MPEEILFGGVANAGAVTRDGDHVLRPSNPHSQSIQRFLSALPELGFDGAPFPVGIDADGRERLVFIEGDVPLPRFPDWAQTDDALASIAELIYRFHEASHRYERAGSSWCDEIADPAGGRVMCHNDVCLENVVFRDGTAVGLLDFDFAAPGRPTYDLAHFARMCTPIDDPINAARNGFHPADLPVRLRLIANTYGLDAEGRSELLGVLDASIKKGGAFVRRRVEAGDPGFIEMWNNMGGSERFDRRTAWWNTHVDTFAAALR